MTPARLPRRSGRPPAARGFSLAELLVTLVLFGLVTGLAVPAVSNLLETGWSHVCSVNLKRINLAAADYFLDHPQAADLGADPWPLLAPYLHGDLPRCPAGGDYRFAADGTCHCSLGADNPARAPRRGWGGGWQGAAGAGPAEGWHDGSSPQTAATPRPEPLLRPDPPPR